jgi:hypothetical protein
MITLFIIISCIRYGRKFKSLNQRSHPLKNFYGCGYWIFQIGQKVRKQKDKNKTFLEEILVKKNVQEEYIIHESQKYTYFVGVLWLSIVLCFALAIISKGNFKDTTSLKRPDYGEDSINYQLQADYDGEQDIDVLVEARTYPEEQLEEIFESTYQELLEMMIKNNQDFQKVNHKLVFLQPITYSGVSAEWIPSDYDLIDSSGNVFLDSVPEEGLDTSVWLTLSCQEKEERYEILITLIPPEQTKEEELKKEFIHLIQASEEENRTEEYFSLPTQFNNQSISYNQKDSVETIGIIFLLGMIMAFLVVFNQDVKLKNQIQKREKQMMMDYSQIVSKFTILIGAGMSVKGAWLRIVEDYQKNKGKEKRYAYEEMTYTSKLMMDGMTETQAYLEFGKRCRLHSYLKFSSLLEQNLRKGTRGLVVLLQNETSQAFLERKHLAKRYGEKMSTRLMIPMMMFFVMVLVIIMVPAFLTF